MAYPLFHERGPRDVPMVLDPGDFTSAFPAETESVEFKQGVPEVKIAEAVTAFSNTDGGVVLLGVDNSGRVTGIATDGEMQARVHRIVARVHSPGRYEVRELLVGEKRVLVLAVHRRQEGFAQMHDGRILVRRGAMNTALFGEEMTRFVSQRALTRFESTATSVLAKDADSGLREQIAQAFGWSGAMITERLAEAGLVHGTGEGAALTVAGVLYLCERPADHLGKAYVELFRYRDATDVYDRRVEFDGPVHHQVEDVTRAVVEELGSDVVVIGVHRHELPRIPETVLREAVANAVAHRTYENSRQPVRVEIRPDRVVIRSPGGLPEPVTLENMREQNAARNIHLIKVLRRLRLAEDAGLGVDVMQDAMEAAMLELPEFGADASHVVVTLRLGSTVTPQERAWLAEVELRGEIRNPDRVLLLHAARGELLTNTSVRELLGVDSTHARSALHRLRDLGYLRQSGQRGGASYALARELGPPAGLQLDAAELEQLVLAMAAEGPLTNESVRMRTGLDRAQALSVLSRLVESGALRRVGERRGTSYVLPPSFSDL
ncbi:ATP-binding protein [Cellulosimicrobium cellulans]|uniref:ATP-binding protein n=1 Tax=Cellulosimicrobium cellulans TaxID=1710 RepID=UPI0024069E94|nr:ATP-binding protein [Cellulosimicrobium cellulans]MDF9877127.1 ATP-dependent DNA helicase RecG [Cellulosimicrobium cellulans]